MDKLNSRLKILTWHIHGNYLYYLTRIKSCDFYIPYPPLGNGFLWGDNVHEVPGHKVKDLNLDIILFQSDYPRNKNYLEDQYRILTPKQQTLPKVYLEHDPPRQHPTDTKHIVKDKNILLVNVTYFNNLMWDSGDTPVKVIEHGVAISPKATFKGDIKKGVVVVNNLKSRGRRLGLDIFEEIRKKIPLDLYGMDSEALGGLGEISHSKLADVLSHYCFFLYPLRYTSLGLTLCEAMTLGMPVVALATTETVTVIQNGINGFTDTDPARLIPPMKKMLEDIDYAKNLGKNAKKTAEKRFNIKRFIAEWEQAFNLCISRSLPFSNQTLRENLPNEITIDTVLKPPFKI